MPVRSTVLAVVVAVLATSSQAVGAVPLQGAQVDLASGSNGRIQSAVDNAYAGAARPVGDVNGDGVADMAFSEGRADSDAGRIVVVLGGAGTPAFTSPDVGARGFVIRGRPGSRLSQVAAAGDVNGDGIDDLIAGAFTDDTTGSQAGAAYVIFGTRAPGDVDLAALGGGGFAIRGDATDFLGASVSGVGDLNGDGRSEVVVGGYCAEPGSGCGAGEAYVVFGRPGTTTVDVHAPSFSSQGFVMRDSAGATGQQFGAVVRGIGDFNGDGVRDIAVWATSNGAPQYLKSAWVVFGKSTTAAVDVATGGAVRIDPPTPVSPTPDQFTGAPYDAGDVNGDGRGDVIMGVPEDGALGRSLAGGAVVVYGRPGTTTISPLALGSGGFRIEGASAGDYMAPTGSSADLDGDGRRELLLTASEADSRGRADSGSVWVIPAVPPTLGAAYDLLFPPPGARQIDGASAGDRLASAAGVGDVNGDGRPDLTVGGTRIGGNNRGASELLLGFGTPAVQYPGIAGTAGTPIAPVAPTDLQRTGTPSFSATGLPDGLSIDAASGVISGTPQHATSGTATVTMTDLAGSAAATLPLSVAAAAAAPQPRVTLSSVSISPRRFAVARRKGSRAPVGARVRWKLTAAAPVTVTIERLIPGRRSGKRCVARGRTGARCTRAQRVGAFSVDAPAGIGSLKLPGTPRKVRLTPGSYRVTVAVKNGPVAAPARFTVLR